MSRNGSVFVVLDGYKKLLGGTVHEEIVLNNGSIEITDLLEGPFVRATARLYIHPSLSVEQSSEAIIIRGKRFTMRSRVEGSVLNVRAAEWFPAFGRTIANKIIEAEFSSKDLKLTFEWEKY